MLIINDNKVILRKIIKSHNKKIVFKKDNKLYLYKDNKTYEIESKQIYTIVEFEVPQNFSNKNFYYVYLDNGILLLNSYDLDREIKNTIYKLNYSILNNNSKITKIIFKYITENYFLIICNYDDKYNKYKILDINKKKILEINGLKCFSYITIHTLKNNITILFHKRNDFINFDTLDIYPKEMLQKLNKDSITQPSKDSLCKIYTLDFNKFIKDESNYIHPLIENPWFEESSIINSPINDSKNLYILTKNFLSKDCRVYKYSNFENSFINKEEFNLNKENFNKNIFEFKDKIYIGPKFLQIFEDPKDFNLRIINILDNSDFFHINLEKISMFVYYSIINDNKLIIEYIGHEENFITSCIYNKAINTFKKFKGCFYEPSLYYEESILIKN